MLTTPGTIGIGLAAVIAIGILAMFTGTFMSIIVIGLVVAMLVYILHLYGYISLSSDKQGLDIGWHENPVAPVATSKVTAKAIEAPVVRQEAFYVSGNRYTYEEAPAVCAAYGAQLATYDQIMEAYASGAEWCGYGWTQGGMALYPTQDATWQELIQESSEAKRTACGRPGVNGGYFDPNTKFGVNCYGVKPTDKHNTQFPTPLPGTDMSEFNKLGDRFKSMINRMTIAPYNRNEWSEYSQMPQLGSTGGQAVLQKTPTVNK
jgi:hypothetical protein